jgi:hypothetical protein
MAIPAVLHAAAASQLGPLLGALAWWGRRPPIALRWILVWCALLVLGDALYLATAYAQGHNLWLQYVTEPAQATAALWALALWQNHFTLALAQRLAIPLLVLVTAGTAAFAPGVPSFDLFLAPLYALVLLAAALTTLLRRALTSEGHLLRQDWFWASLGIALYAGVDVAVQPFAQALVVPHPDWVRQVYLAKAWIDILAFGLVTVGVLCPRFLHRSSGRS